MAEYGYEDLQKKIFNELKTAITKSGKEAVKAGLLDIMKEEYSVKGINIDTKELEKSIDQEIDRALTKTKSKKIRNFNYSLIGADEKEIRKAVEKAYGRYQNADTSQEMQLAVKEFISSMEVAKARSVKIAKEIASAYNEELFGKDSTIKEWFSPKIITDFKDRIIEEISSINLKEILNKSIDEYSKSTSIDKVYGKILTVDGKRKKVLNDIGLSKNDFLKKLQKENKEIEKGNDLFKERITYLKDNKVVESYIGDKDSV